MPTILLIRHGESRANAGFPTPSPENVDLTDRGWKQADHVARFLREARFYPDLIITSSYQRTKRTAAPTTLSFPSVREEQWPVHEFTYLSMWLEEVSTIDDRRESVIAYWQNADPRYIDGPGAESFAQFIDRVRNFKARLESSDLSTIAVFSHEQFISAFLWLLECDEIKPTSKEMSDFRSYLLAHPIPNGALVQAKFHRGYDDWSFEMITDHLSEAEEKLAEEKEAVDMEDWMEERELEPVLSR